MSADQVPAPKVSSPHVPALDVTGLTVRYGEVVALDGATFTLPPSGVTGLVGMNGSGKSTLFNAVMGLVRPAAGQVRILGTSPERARRRGLVGYVPQQEAVDWTFPVSVAEVVMMGRYGRMGPTRRPADADRRAVAEALDRVELTPLAHRRIGALSGGQRKRAFVARCLAQGARVMLLDEPFAGVDQRSEATMSTLLRELAADGRTVLVSTHDLQSLDTLCDDALLLQRRVLLHADPAQVLRPENLARAFGAVPGSESAAPPGAQPAAPEVRR